MFEAIVQVAYALGIRDIKRFPNGWHYKLDDAWEWVVNGTKVPIDVMPQGTMGCMVPSFCAAVFYHGWLAGVFSPYGGAFAAGDGANKETFLAAVRSGLLALGDSRNA